MHPPQALNPLTKLKKMLQEQFIANIFIPYS